MNSITHSAANTTTAPAEELTSERLNELLQRRINRAVVLELPSDSIAMTDLLGFAASIGHRVTFKNGRFVLRPIKPANILQRGLKFLTTTQAEF